MIQQCTIQYSHPRLMTSSHTGILFQIRLNITNEIPPKARDIPNDSLPCFHWEFCKTSMDGNLLITGVLFQYCHYMILFTVIVFPMALFSRQFKLQSC